MSIYAGLSRGLALPRGRERGCGESPEGEGIRGTMPRGLICGSSHLETLASLSHAIARNAVTIPSLPPED